MIDPGHGHAGKRRRYLRAWPPAREPNGGTIALTRRHRMTLFEALILVLIVLILVSDLRRM